jgi:hypothetical protein
MFETKASGTAQISAAPTAAAEAAPTTTPAPTAHTTTGNSCAGLTRREAIRALPPTDQLPDVYQTKPQVAARIQLRTVRFKATDIDRFFDEHFRISRRSRNGGAR